MIRQNIDNMHLLINHHFKDDMKRVLRKDILDIGYPASAIDPDNVIYQYFVLKKRLIKKCPRQIEYADTFARPTNQIIEQGLTLLEEKIRRGDNINPHLNRAMTNVNYADKLLFDWGIYHFHLGMMTDADGFIHRTGDLLYAVVTADKVYCLNVASHGHWADKDFLETIARNWDFLLSEYELPGVTPTKVFDSTETAALRKVNVNILQQLSNGKTYVPRGGGMLGNGGSSEAQQDRMQLESYIERFAKDIEKKLKEQICKDVKELLTSGGRVKSEIPIVHHYILDRISEDKINLILIDEQEGLNILEQNFPIPSLKKIVYG